MKALSFLLTTMYIIFIIIVCLYVSHLLDKLSTIGG